VLALLALLDSGAPEMPGHTFFGERHLLLEHAGKLGRIGFSEVRIALV
jgi:hypothetical protein